MRANRRNLYPHPFSLRFRYPVICVQAEGSIQLEINGRRLLRPDTPESRLLIQSLSTPGIHTARQTLSLPPFTAWSQFAVAQFEALGLIRYEVLSAARAVLTLEPLTTQWRLSWTSLGEQDRIRASRFAGLRMESGQCFLESPLSSSRVRFEDPSLCELWAMLATNRRIAECASRLGKEFPEASLRQCLELFVCAGVAGIANSAGELEEDLDPNARLWSYHELLFHSRSRRGRHDLGCGSKSIFLSKIPETPPRKAPLASDPFPLPLPRNLPYTTVFQAIEARRSTRAWDDEHPVTLEQLASLLYVSCRTLNPEAVLEMPPLHTRVHRPAPAGGSTGELEVYLVVRCCEGLPGGAWHYESHTHSLYALEDKSGSCELLLKDAQSAMGSAAQPQILMILSARHARVLRKYSSLGYALELKDAGVLFQTLYLAGTALGIGVCALGSGDAELFGQLTGNLWLEESSVGELAIGSLPAASHPTPNGGPL